MVRRKTQKQKGSGFLNRIKTVFQRRNTARKVAPAPKEERVKDESYLDALKRDYVFFYFKLKGAEPPKEKRFVSPQEEEEVKQVLLEAKGRGLDQDEIIREVFKADPVQFQQELSDWEEYRPEGFLNKGTPYERRAFPIAKSVDRFIGTIQSSPKELKYKSNFMVNICDTTNFDEAAVTLSDDYCIAVLKEEMREQYEDNKGSAYPISYIVVKSQFFPPRVTISGGPITLNAKRIPTVSFLIDAFRQKGVLEIEPVLQKTLQREAPELLQFSFQNPIVLITPYSLTDPSTTQDRFLVLDPVFFTRGRNVLNLKDLSKLSDAFAKRKVYIMDPKTMYELRSKYYQLWLANYGSTNASLYRRLSPVEQLTFCFLQYIKFQEFYSLFRDALDKNDETTKARKTLYSVQKARGLVFDADYQAGANPYELAENFRGSDKENWRQLIQLQRDVFGSAAIQTPQQLNVLLSKFTLRKDAIAETVVRTTATTARTATTRNRKQRVKQMLSQPERNQQRAVLMNQFKTALKHRVKSSILPNFLRTRKAKQRNAQAYRNQIETARQQILEFNRKHGIQTKESTFGYNF